MGTFPAPRRDAHLAWRSPQQAPRSSLPPLPGPAPFSHHSPPTASSSTRQTHPGLGHLHPPPWKDQLLGKEVWAFSICKTLRPGLEPLPPSFGGAFLRQRVEPWVFSGPIASPPDTPKPLAPTQETVSSTSPHGTLLINYSNSERKEERVETLKPWELVNQELKFKTNALSCGAPRHVFFFWQFC